MEPYDAAYFNHDCCKPFFHEGGPKGVLLIHGFTGSVSHMRPLGDALADKGYTVMGINLPGHATTERDMAQSDATQWLKASREALRTLARRCPTVTAAGLSMGGLLALRLAEEGLAAACVTVSAPMATQNWWLRVAGLAAPFHPRTSWAPDPQRHLTLDPAFDYGYSGFPTRKAADLYHLIRLARRNLRQVTCPLLVVQSTGDRAVWPGSADCILRGAMSGRKQKLLLESVPHACTISAEMPKIADAMDQLMRAL